MTDADNKDTVSLLRRRIDQTEIDLYGEILAGVDYRPAFHLVMRIDGGDAAIARCRTTLASLASQAYAEWTLHLVTRYRDADFGELVARLRDGSDNVRDLRQLVSRWLDDKGDFAPRLLTGFEELADRVRPMPRGGDDSLASLAATGPGPSRPGLIAILRAGDELGCDALAELAVAAGLNRDAEFLYGDEERLNCGSGAVAAFCKPQWSPELLLSTNYIGRLWCATSGLIARTGATVTELLRRGEYDLVLRCTEAARAIQHVPAVMCRRGTDPLDSPALERQALARALDRRAIDGEILPGNVPGTYRVKRRAVAGRRVSVIIPTRGARGLFKVCLDTLRRITGYDDVEIIAVDDIPEGEAAAKAWLRGHADKVIAGEAPFNWSRYNNRAAREATGEFLLFLNDDVEIIEPDWLAAMLEHAARPEIGAVGPLLLYPDDTVQHAGMFLAETGNARHAFRGQRREAPGYFGLAHTQREVTAVTGACLLTRRDLFWELGGFDEAHTIVNNDLDYCLKIRERGLLCIFTPYAALIHHERASRGSADEQFDRAVFEQRWGGAFSHGDPYHHPALSRETDDIAVTREPVEIVCTGRPLFDRGTIRRILVLKLDHLGDCVGGVPAIRRLKRHFPEATIHVMSGPWAKQLWAMVPEIDATLELTFFRSESSEPHIRLQPKELETLRQALAPYRFDLAIDLRRHGETRHLLRCAEARYTAGFDIESRFPWLDVALDWSGDPRGIRKRQYFGDMLCDLVDAVAAAGERERAVFRPVAAAVPPSVDPELAAMFARPVVCIHPAVGVEMRRWPASHFAELADLLIEHDDVNVVLVGGAGDAAIAAAVLDKVRNRDRVGVAVGKIPLVALPAFLTACALFIGNNSGPKHIAAGLGVPTVGVHAANVDPREWGPLGPVAVSVWRHVECAPCHLTSIADCERGLACLTGLRPIDVYPACKRLLAIGRGRAVYRPAPRVAAVG